MDVNKKRKLCKQIYDAYIEVSAEIINVGSRIPFKTYQNLSKVEGEDIKSFPKYEKPIMELSTLGAMGSIFASGDYYNEAKKYEKLEKSWRLYFVRELKLTKVLEELPTKHKTRQI